VKEDRRIMQRTEAAGSRHVAEISREEILDRLRDPRLVLVDVLPREAYALEHIPGALNLPLTELQSRAGEVLPDQGKDIAVYCATFT
jgi:ArsR family transcriptional regulator